MNKSDIDARVNAFELSMDTLRTTDILKHNDILNKVERKINDIKSHTSNYTDQMEIYWEYSRILDLCEALIPYYSGKTGSYFKHWVDEYKVRGINV